METENKGKRGSKSASIELNYSGDKSEIGKIVWENAKYFRTKPVESNEECEERLDKLFESISNGDEFPTVEKIALCLGTTRQRLFEWENMETKGPVRADMIKKAKEIMAAIDAHLVQSGKIPQVTYIFRSKNYYGMKDVQDVVIAPNNPLGSVTDPDKLMEKYRRASPSDEE